MSIFRPPSIHHSSFFFHPSIFSIPILHIPFHISVHFYTLSISFQPPPFLLTSILYPDKCFLLSLTFQICMWPSPSLLKVSVRETFFDPLFRRFRRVIWMTLLTWKLFRKFTLFMHFYLQTSQKFQFFKRLLSSYF